MEILSTLQAIAKAIEKAFPGYKCHCYAMETQISVSHSEKCPDGIAILIPFYQLKIKKGVFTDEMTEEIIHDLRKIIK